MHDHSKLIDAVGGRLVQSHFSLSRQRLYAWRKRGIPWTHRSAFVRLASLHGKPIPEDFFTPPEARKAS